MISQNALSRKQRSEEILKNEGVPFISHLPVIEDEGTAKFRSQEEIAWRAMAICIVAVKGEGLEQERVLEIVEQYQLDRVFSPKEREFVYGDLPSERDRVQFSWQYECYWVLLWALGYVENLSRPDKICDVPFAVKIMIDRSPEEFIKEAKQRRFSDILDEADLIYRYDWACVDARVNGLKIPSWMECGVILERHRTLNWLIGYPENAEWDEVTTDT